uniref:ATP synthase complex subunit 8 n=1 Tax=Pentacheles validus TaxID=2508670 RepID=A0A410RF13_9EUCA|nr:ATP synthase F0 subunit 8 [Pentacheles validus]QAT80323.1 ATP synthase F0 subunit 8 [Pentacheles validus]
MPQMAPLLWTSLFAFFLLNFLLFFVSTYFLLPPSQMKYETTLPPFNEKNWKW